VAEVTQDIPQEKGDHLKLFTTALLTLIVLGGSAAAERPWAPGAKSPGKSSSSFSMPPLVLRMGVSFTSTNITNSENEDVSYSGLQLEAAIRPLIIPVASNTELMLDIPLVFSLLRGKVYDDETSIGLIGRGIPTARLGITLSSGIEISPFVGFGAGSNLNISGVIADDWQLVWVYRIGTDAMFSKSFGVGIAFTRNSVGDIDSGHWVEDQYGAYWDSESKDLVLKELSLSLIIKL